MFADLHLHTHFSDGTFSPEELVNHASRAGLSTIALTDHDTVEGCDRTARACGEKGIGFIPGTELTGEFENHEIHLLGYYLDTTHVGLLSEILKFQKVRQTRIVEMVSRLNRLGIPLQTEVVFKLANCQSPGRPHVARALVQEGFCSSLDEAFDRFLKQSRPGWVPKFRISAFEAVDLIHRAGGLAVLAHPGLNRSDDAIPVLKGAGLDGLECFHTKHSPSASEHYAGLARKYDLLITGGSDCHGMSKGKPLIGTVKLPMEYVRLMNDRQNTTRISSFNPG